jgi:hypothetical protein
MTQTSTQNRASASFRSRLQSLPAKHASGIAAVLGTGAVLLMARTLPPAVTLEQAIMHAASELWRAGIVVGAFVIAKQYVRGRAVEWRDYGVVLLGAFFVMAVLTGDRSWDCEGDPVLRPATWSECGDPVYAPARSYVFAREPGRSDWEVRPTPIDKVLERVAHNERDRRQFVLFVVLCVGALAGLTSAQRESRTTASTDREFNSAGLDSDAGGA